MSAPEHPVTGKPGEPPQPSDGAPRSASILGLSIVSGLNVISLAFIAYHYAGHPDALPAAPTGGPTSGDLMTAGQSWPPAGLVTTTASAFGNVDLLPASKHVIEIASGIVNEHGSLTERQEAATVSRPRTAETSAEAGDRPGYWVQLGALSKEDTAHRYWTTLKRRHATLLQNQEPRYFGPADGGGDLFHIRLGPLEGDAASGLCEKLEAEGADCFCVRPSDEQSR